MHISQKLVAGAAVLALGATPAFAGDTPAPTTPGSANRPATAPPSNDGTARMPSSTPQQAPASVPQDDRGQAGTAGEQGTSHKPATPGPRAGMPAKAKAYGRSCQGQSKERVAGEHGSAFSRCVTAMAKVASGQSDSPRTACKDLSRRRADGERRSAFSRCVAAAAKLLAQRSDGD
ncbi:MAG TPA: hypothetical protein VLB47_15095 [Solirubrobacteraceae bacterium]|nr:hypothetical protein [Solirubrobacteraceae bacterium]